MTEDSRTPRSSVKHIKLENRDIYLVGTAHVSKESVEEVRKTVEEIKPDTICVELCSGRHKSMTQPDAWKNTDIFKLIKEKKSVLLLAQLIMMSFYRRLGEKLGVEPGAEMLEGVKLAEQTNAELVLADREIEITLKRVWGYLSFWHKIKMLFQLTAGLFTQEKVDEDLIEQMKEIDQLENAMETFAKALPEVKIRLVDERDIFLSQKIRKAPGKKIVAVVGAAHCGGIEKYIHEDIPLEPLCELPPKSPWPRIFKWALPILIIGLLILSFFKGSAPEAFLVWTLVNGILSALGAAIALGHPLTIIASFLAAPITSLSPMIAAGWVAGIVQAWVKKPTVEDFQNLPQAVKTTAGFWKNNVTRILLVVCLANLGSAIGTWIAIPWIVKILA